MRLNASGSSRLPNTFSEVGSFEQWYSYLSPDSDLASCQLCAMFCDDELTFAGSPPNAAMLSRKNASARR